MNSEWNKEKGEESIASRKLRKKMFHKGAYRQMYQTHLAIERENR